MNRRKPSLTSLIAFGMIFAAYVLSPGPLAALVDAGHIQEDGAWGIPVRVVYWPLHVCYENIEWVESSYDWYVELWIDSGPTDPDPHF